MTCSFNDVRCVSADEEDECRWAQAALPGPVAPPAAGRQEAAAAAAWREEVTSSTSASWGRLLAARRPPRQSPGGHIWRNGPPERRGRSQIHLRTT